MGARPVAVDAETHDRLVAVFSHLPHVLANVLVRQAAERLLDEGEALRQVGPSFRDATRVAGANTAMWADVYRSNREAVVEEVRRFARSLDEVADLLESGGGVAELERRGARGPPAPARGGPGRPARARAAPDGAEPPRYRRPAWRWHSGEQG